MEVDGSRRHVTFSVRLARYWRKGAAANGAILLESDSRRNDIFSVRLAGYWRKGAAANGAILLESHSRRNEDRNSRYGVGLLDRAATQSSLPVTRQTAGVVYLACGLCIPIGNAMIAQCTFRS
ncbi:hypothetical protein ACJJTC_003495 [Scirpophaga incertulas]